jgi:hypothetical protein
MFEAAAAPHLGLQGQSAGRELHVHPDAQHLRQQMTGPAEQVQPVS